MSYKRFLQNSAAEITRDFTSFGNPFLLIFVSAIAIGVNFRLAAIIGGLVFVELFSSTIKFFYYKRRPKQEKYDNFLERINAGSFPSLHSARSSFVFVTLFFLFSNYYLKIVLLLIPIIVGMTRISLKKHYLYDIIAGYIIGILTFIALKFFLII